MATKGQDIVSVIKQQIEQFGTQVSMVDVGKVIEIGDGIARIYGLAEQDSADVAIAGGTETLSDVPIRVSRPIRERLVASRKVKGVGGWLGLLKGLKLRDLAPEVPAIADFSTGLTMGQNAERLAKRIGISRADQDDYALTSHHRAAEATRAGKLLPQIVPARVKPGWEADSASTLSFARRTASSTSSSRWKSEATGWP